MPEPAKKQEETPLHLAADTWFLMVDVAEEARIATAWVQKNAPIKIEQNRLTNELNTYRLDRQHAVVAIVRRGPRHTSPKPLIGSYKNSDGERLDEHTPIEELLDEVQMGAPIRCIEHWQEGAGGRFDGALNIATFMAELGKTALPYVLAWRDLAASPPSRLVLRYG